MSLDHFNGNLMGQMGWPFQNNTADGLSRTTPKLSEVRLEGFSTTSMELFVTTRLRDQAQQQ